MDGLPSPEPEHADDGTPPVAKPPVVARPHGFPTVPGERRETTRNPLRNMLVILLVGLAAAVVLALLFTLLIAGSCALMSKYGGSSWPL
jgi:hypothetical protein